MVQFFMDLIHSGGTTTFDITPEFFPRLELDWRRFGGNVRVRDTVPIHGWISDDDPSVVRTRWTTLKTIAQNKTPIGFKFRDDSGNILHQFTNAHLTSLEDVADEGGSMVNHVEFRVEVTEERSVVFPGVIDVGHTDELVNALDGDGQPTQMFVRTVFAGGQFGSMNSAKNFVMQFKPSATISQYVSEKFQWNWIDTIFTATWEVNLKKKTANQQFNGIKSWREKAVRVPGRRSRTWYRTHASPKRIDGGFGPSVIQVSGTIEAYQIDAFPDAEELVMDFDLSNATATDDDFNYEDIHLSSPYIVTKKAPNMPSLTNQGTQPGTIFLGIPSQSTLGQGFGGLPGQQAPGEPEVWAVDYSFNVEFAEFGEPDIDYAPPVRF